MKPTLFVLAVVAVAWVLLPEEAQILGAARRSRPRPELEEYYRSRLDGPAGAAALRELVRIRESRRDADGALALRERLRLLEPDDLQNLEALMKAYAWRNRTAEALALAEGLIARSPGRADLRELAVELAEYRGRAAEALPHARWLLERGVRNPRMARAFIAAKDVDGVKSILASPRKQAEALVAIGAQLEAIRAYREHLAAEPLDVGAKRWLARLYRWNGRPLEAAAELEESLAIDDDPEVREELLGIYRSVNRIDLMLPHLPEGLERAEILVALGRVEEAKRIYWKYSRFDKLLELARGMPLEDEELQIREKMPMDEENRKRLADLYSWRKDFAKALALYESVYHERAVDMYLALGDMEGALRVARQLGLHRRLGDMYLWAGDLERAAAEYLRVPGEELEVTRLYIVLGKKAEALRILDALAGGEPYSLANLYLYAGRADRAAGILARIPPEELDLERVEEMARAADGPAAVAFFEMLLRHRPRHEPYLLALAEHYEWLGRKEDYVRTLRVLLELRPRDAELHAKLGLFLSDKALLERALALGSREPLVLRRLAEIARGERRVRDAVELYRAYHRLKDDDPESHFALAELTGDPAEYRLAWDLLPPGEKRIRARILVWRGELALAEKLLREANDVEGLVDLLLQMKRYREAEALPMTARQRAVLAILRGRHAEAVKLLKQLDLTDPDVRTALGDSLFALGRWMEAERYAGPELRREIRGTYGAEASTDLRLYDSADERHVALTGRYRMYVTEDAFFRVGASWDSLKGRVLALGEDRAVSLERADALFFYRLTPEFRVGGGVAGWHSDLGEAASGILEATYETGEVALDLFGEFDGPWMETLEAALLGGTRHRLAAQASASPLERLFVLAAVERLRYQASDDAEFGPAGETAEEFRARARVEFRLWTGKGSAGRYFYDLPLRRESSFGTHVSLFAQADYAKLDGDEPLVRFVQLLPESRMLTAGPSAGWAGKDWAVTGSFFIGQDDARDLGFGRLWGGSAGAVATFADEWKFGAFFDYVNEQRQAAAGSAWTFTFGLNHNF